jgi:hypothetical protein
VQKERQGTFKTNLWQKRGFRLLRRAEPKDLRQKNKNKNTLGTIETWMPERGETFLHQTPRHQSLDPHYKKNPEDNSAQERGRRFLKNSKFPRVASVVSK